MKEYKILETSKQATDEQEHNYKCPACKGIKKRYALTLNIWKHAKEKKYSENGF